MTLATNNSTCGFDLIEPRHPIEARFDHLKEVKEQIAHLQVLKQQIEEKILTELNLVTYKDGEIVSVKHDGSKKYTFGSYNVTFTTKSSWKINVSEYEVLAKQINPEFNPVRISKKYDFNNKIYQQTMVFGSEEDKAILKNFLTMKYAAPTIVIGI